MGASPNPIQPEWAHQNTIYCEKHDVFPVYLKTQYEISGNINVPFNLINIPWFIHWLLHTLRFLEFGYVEDSKVIKITLNKMRLS